MDSFDDLVRKFQNGMISMSELRAFMAFVDECETLINSLKAAATGPDVTDCGDYRLRIVPWDGQP